MSNPAVVQNNKVEPKTFGREWLSPGVYTLDLSAVKDIPMTVNGDISTFGDVYCKLRDSKITEMPNPFSSFESTYSTDSGDVKINADWNLLSTMHTLVEPMGTRL